MSKHQRLSFKHSENSKWLPNFYILGAPKCGTTAMAAYLSEHPKVLFSEPKETNFFNTDHKEQELFSSIDEYLQFGFKDAQHFKHRGEGSVWYLFSEEATSNILHFNPSAKFVVMLRKPSDLVYALHATYLLGVMEDEEDFTTAWKLQVDRAQGRNIPKTCPEPKLLQYGEVGKLGAQVSRLLGQVDRRQVHFIIYDDFKANTQKTYQDLLQFLGIPDDFRSDFKAINQAQVTKNKSLGKGISVLTQNKFIYRIKRTLGLTMGEGPLVKLLHKNRMVQKRVALSDDFKAELKAYFKSDIKDLEAILKRDLSHWYD